MSLEMMQKDVEKMGFFSLESTREKLQKGFLWDLGLGNVILNAYKLKNGSNTDKLLVITFPFSFFFP
jgi:hypothetical protein